MTGRMLPDVSEGPFMDLTRASEEERTGGAGSRVLFPLRTGVELFADPSMPEAVARAKQAAVLYDEVVFETGLYEVSIAKTGTSGWWHPQETLTDERLADSRRVQAAGTPFTLSVATEGSDRAATFIDSPLVAAYASEYHTGILDELSAYAPDWVKVLTLQNKPPLSTPEGKLFRRLVRRDKRDETFMPESRHGAEHFKRNWIIQTFNRDLVVSTLIGASFNPTSLFAPMMQRRGFAADRFGASALGVVVPNVGGLPWEAVVEFRQHPASGEARAMLRKFEEKAVREEPEDANAVLRSIETDVREALFAAYQELRPSWPKRIALEGLKTLVGLVPFIGPIGGLGMTAAELGSDLLKDRRSWVAALMVLKRRSS